MARFNVTATAVDDDEDDDGNESGNEGSEERVQLLLEEGVVCIPNNCEPTQNHATPCLTEICSTTTIKVLEVGRCGPTRLL